MPTYEYACTDCGQHLEVVQSFTDEPLTTCAVCGGPMRKVFGAIGIVLKGSGFYKNDSRSSPTKSGEAGGSKKGSDGESTPSAPAKESSGDKSSTSTSSGSGSSGESSSVGSSSGGAADRGSSPAKAATT
jgi:putative FmdB family regulatory protein